MKRFMKFLSVLLVLVICFSLSSPAFALSLPITAEPTVVTSNELILSEQDGHIISMLGEDLSNGDARFSMLKDGEIISASYVDRSESSITYTQYEDGIETSRSVTIVEPVPPSETAATATYTSVGKVGYYHYVQGMVMCTNYISWSYNKTLGSGYYDINGFYKDLTEFASFLMQILSLVSTVCAMELAAFVFDTLGKAFDLANVILSSVPPVSCNKTTVTWRAVAGTKSALITGAQCSFIINGKTKIGYDGNYYPTTAIANHNSTLALTPYASFFPGSDNYEIASWPS